MATLVDPLTLCQQPSRCSEIIVGTPTNHPQLPGVEPAWLGPPDVHWPKGGLRLPSMSKEGMLWGRLCWHPSSGKACLSSKVLLSAPAHNPPGMSEGGTFPSGGESPTPSNHLNLAMCLTNWPSFFPPGRRAIKRQARKQWPAASALSAFTTISKGPHPGWSGLMHSPPLAPTPPGAACQSSVLGGRTDTVKETAEKLLGPHGHG